MKSRGIRGAEHVGRIGEKRKEYRLLVGKSEGKRPLRGLRRGWVDNIGMDLGEVGWGDVDWIGNHGSYLQYVIIITIINL
jgi:hypothetical protein